ncbi:WG repeat-containing protein [Paludibacter sp.]|uniref:WG repeat-containing protein n=1 Tax=Paludibacter sp. TaxID=1898105 RepID=UPI001354D8CF|nr:WG repeat-containing protein [Paludibacter sp.]MTK53104.1 WG repeat-containing protein [Paludibacter sp.]
MKNLSKFWKVVLILLSTTTTILLIYLCWFIYDKHYGVFSSPDAFNSKLDLVLYKDGKYALQDNSTNKIITSKFDWIATPGKQDTLIVFCKNSKRGFIDAYSGQMAINAKYERAWNFSEGLAAVVMNGQLGFVNEEGQLFIPCKFHYTDEKAKLADYVFTEGSCTVMDSKGKFGLINKKGVWILSPKYDFINKPILGYRIVKMNNLYGLLNSKLQLVLPVTYNHIEIEKSGIKLAKDGGQQLIAFDMKTVLKPFVYDSIASLQYGSGRNDSTGTEIMINTNCFAYNIFTKWGLMKRDGTVVTKAIYDEIDGLGQNLFSCTIEGYKQMINANGK